MDAGARNGARVLTGPMTSSATAEPTTILRSVASLVDAGVIPRERLPALEAVATRYAVSITPAMAMLIDPADPADPIARQFVPDEAELTATPYESSDPTGDRAHSPVEGVVHRYPDRVLLKPTHVCAVYCRFCFRREVVGPSGERALSPTQLDQAMRYIAGDPQIWEVIVTGGDPLVLSPRRLADLIARLEGIDHVKVIRFHTRVPIVAPELVDAERVAALRSSTRAVYVAVHANHARELTLAARAACARLAEAGVPLLGQTVLLRGVNDDPETLAALMRALVETRIKPYYLHHGDLAPGTGHLRTTVQEGRALVRGLRGRMSGLCQPSYVLDIPGGYGKSPIGPVYLEQTADGFAVEDPFGGRHLYPSDETAAGADHR